MECCCWCKQYLEWRAFLMWSRLHWRKARWVLLPGFGKGYKTDFDDAKFSFPLLIWTNEFQLTQVSCYELARIFQSLEFLSAVKNFTLFKCFRIVWIVWIVRIVQILRSATDYRQSALVQLYGGRQDEVWWRNRCKDEREDDEYGYLTECNLEVCCLVRHCMRMEFALRQGHRGSWRGSVKELQFCKVRHSILYDSFQELSLGKFS